MVNLSYGSSGRTVSEVQMRLKSIGFPIKEVTGVLDNQTAVAIIHYKRASGITPNNIQITSELLDLLHITHNESEATK